MKIIVDKINEAIESNIRQIKQSPDDEILIGEKRGLIRAKGIVLKQLHVPQQPEIKDK